MEDRFRVPRYEDRAWWQITLTEKEWLRRQLRDHYECLNNADRSRRSLDAQLSRDFGLLYDAPRDMYIRVKKGLQDD